MGQLEGMIQQQKISQGGPITVEERTIAGLGESVTAVQHREEPAFVSPQIVDSGGGFLGAIKGLLVILMMILILSGGGYYGYAFVIQPMRVKEVILVSQPVFEDLHRSGEKILSHLEKEPLDEADSLERYAAEGEELLITAKSNQEKLNEYVVGMKSGMAATYRARLINFSEKVREIIQLEEDNVAFSRAYAEMLLDYEGLTLQVNGISDFIVSDPDRYVASVNKLITDEEKLIEKMKGVQIGKDRDMVEMHKLLIGMLENEVEFLKGMKKGVELGNADMISMAEKAYSDNMQNNQGDLIQTGGRLNRRVSEIGDELNSLGDEVEEAYQEIADRYGL